MTVTPAGASARPASAPTEAQESRVPARSAAPKKAEKKTKIVT